MKNTVQTGLIMLCMILPSINISAQTKEWKMRIIDGGKILVKYSISERTDESGDTVLLIEDFSTTTDTVSMQNCISLMKDVSRHKEFTGDAVSKKIETTSENEWVVYYYTKNPWPIADCDCVAKMIFSEDAAEKTAVFAFTAAPSMFEDRKVKRMTYYNIAYAFKDLGNGRVEVTITGKTSPVIKVPRWIINTAFPGAPADCLRKFVKLAKEIK